MFYKKRRKQRVKGLNRKVFYSNLKRVLKPKYAKDLKWSFEEWVNDYVADSEANGSFGYFEVKATHHIKNYTEQINTN